jgi:hypothetical protein
VTRVQLPDGCYGLEMASGRKYDAPRSGGTVEVDPADARYIGTSFYGQSGIMRGGEQFCIGTRKGRRCPECTRIWQAWSALCPRCNKPTEPYGGM